MGGMRTEDRVVRALLQADGWVAAWVDENTGEIECQELVCWGAVDEAQGFEDEEEIERFFRFGAKCGTVTGFVLQDYRYVMPCNDEDMRHGFVGYYRGAVGSPPDNVKREAERMRKVLLDNAKRREERLKEEAAKASGG